MKRRIIKKKRETFIKIFAKAFAVSAVITAVFAGLLNEIIYQTIRPAAEAEVDRNIISVQNYVSERSSEQTDPEMFFHDLNARLSMYTYLEISLNPPSLIHPDIGEHISLSPLINSRNKIAAVIVDEDNNVVAANNTRLQTIMLFRDNKNGEDTDRGYYICDNREDIHEIGEMYRVYEDWTKDAYCYIDAIPESLYVNKKNHTFIPHKLSLVKKRYKNTKALVESGEIENIDTKEFIIDIDDKNYELMDVHTGNAGYSLDDYPYCALFNFFGANDEYVDAWANHVRFDEGQWLEGYQGNANGTYTFERNGSFSYNNKQYRIYVSADVDFKDPQLMKYYRTTVILFALAAIILALLYSWRRNVVNKAGYAMEDFRRDLTNNLAHDIKTPLMAIGGYAENAADELTSEEDKKKYLASILENVAYTDSIISRTLQLNSMDSMGKVKKEKFEVSKLIDSLFDKYSLMLDEKNIKVKVNGSTELNADKVLAETMLENLISNAVKYTKENGTITADIKSKSIRIVNTVDKKVDTKNLKEPFVKGDAARANKLGSGLGLSIADKAAYQNGFILNIACTDNEFTSEVKI